MPLPGHAHIDDHELHGLQSKIVRMDSCIFGFDKP